MYFILATFLLLAAYTGLLVFEIRRGKRFLATYRGQLDRFVAQGSFIFAHVDFASFLRDESRRIAHRLTHDLAHFSLLSVRAVERLLTRLVRKLRASGAAEPAPRESARHFVRTLSEFKGHIEATRPEVPEIR